MLNTLEMQVRYTSIDSPLGPLLLVSDGVGLSGLYGRHE